MLDFYQKRKFQQILGSRYVQAVVILITLSIIWSAFTRYKITVEMEERRTNVELEAAVLKERKDALELEVQYLSDERGIEAEMRRRFDVAKDGERVVVIVDDETEEVEIFPLATSTKIKRWYEFWR